MLTALSDPSSFDPHLTFIDAESSFVRGHLASAQAEAEYGFQRSLANEPVWAYRFQTLEATVMLWRGLDEDLLQLLTLSPSGVDITSRPNVDEYIQRIALEATAFIHLARWSEATAKLSEADGLCLANTSTQCVSVLRAHGLFYFKRGQFGIAKDFYEQTVQRARASNDTMAEGTAELNLASTLSNQEHHDEALTLYTRANRLANQINAEDLAQTALSGEGWEFYQLGNLEKALEIYSVSRKRASLLGDIDGEIQALTVIADIYEGMGQRDAAERADLDAIQLAVGIGHMQAVADASMDLAQIYIDSAKPDDADIYIGRAETIAKSSGNRLDLLNCRLLTGETAVLRRDWARTEVLLSDVSAASDSQTSMRWTAQHALAISYEAQGQIAAAERAYKAAITLVEAARGDLHQELSQLTFLNNAARIYDDYIHFLVAQGRTDEALEAADWSRARTLQQGLGIVSNSVSVKPPPLRASQIAHATNTTLLFYWLGERQSYLWAVAPERTTLVSLPAKSEIVAKMQRYRRTLLALKDPLRANGGQGDTDGRDLYEALVAPVANIASSNRPVVLFTDGEMTQLNFETLLVGSPTPHYWIEDATVSSSPSIRLFATRSNTASAAQDKLLLLGDSVSVDPAYPALPMAALEINKVKDNFHLSDEVVFSGAQATPRTYLTSKPEQFSYIHFVAHASASTTDPLESAVILSRDGTGDDSYKLYARDILQHPISARLVTISACNSSGKQFYAGEGSVGLSWAFLRAGAHNTIGTLWEVSDASTPDLMAHLYGGLEQKQPPATALRNAKLSLLHSNSSFSRPFYWAPFQLYSGR